MVQSHSLCRAVRADAEVQSSVAMPQKQGRALQVAPRPPGE